MGARKDVSTCALLVGDYQEDRPLLQEIFQEAGWRLLEAPNRQKALADLDHHPVQVVIANCEAPDLDWRILLDTLGSRPHPPQLIVTSRMADEQLWSQVLNCGGYDVVPRPFRRDEIERVIASARRHYDLRSSVQRVSAA